MTGMGKKSLLILLLVGLNVINASAYSSPYYDYNSNIRLAQQDLYALRLNSAERLLQTEELRNPNNGYVTYYRLYSELIALTIFNSPEEFKKKIPVLNQYIKSLRELPDTTPDYRLLLGESYFFTGLIKVKYDNKLSGLTNVLKGYNLLEENSKKYPLFEPDYKTLGIVQIGVAFLPRMFQWGIKLFNIKSDPQEGLKKLSGFSKFADGKPGYEEEAFLATLAAYRLMNQDEAAMKLIKDKMPGFKDIAVLNLIAAAVSLQANDAETALALLANITKEKMEIECPQALYLTAKAKLMRLDPDTDVVLLNYLKMSSGNDYVKSILYDLACFYFISGNTSQYRTYIKQVKEKGREFLSRDIEADFEAGQSEIPNIYLMRADFLVRGGYYAKAGNELSEINDVTALSVNDKVEYYYLEGECCRLKNLVSQAESDYLNASRIGKSSGNYIAQKALVNSGLMMEKNSFHEKAKEYYNKCLEFNPANNPYSDLYKKKAKSGLMRLSLYK
jgi:hypothetical protein